MEGGSSGDGDQPVVLVTGCSKGGMGHALALAFADRRCRVVASSRSLSSMEGMDEHPGVELLELDILSESSVSNGVAAVMERWKRIDILVNNAGVHCVAPVAELPISLLESTFNTNVYGALRLIQAVVPDMIGRGEGKIVNIGSVTAFASGPWVGGYGASKAALHALSDSLRVELKPFGVRVVTVAPCAIKSNLGANSSTIYKSFHNWKFYKPWESAIKARTIASQLTKSTNPQDFANTVVEVILQKNAPPNFTTGYMSGLYAMLYYLPLHFRDWIMKSYFGVHDLPKIKKVA